MRKYLIAIVLSLLLCFPVYGADQKISELTALGVEPASDDYLPILDSSTGITKKVAFTYLKDIKNVNLYGGLTAAVATIGAVEATLLITDAQTVANNLSIPTTMQLFVTRGGDIAVSAGKVLTINGTILAGAYQIFSGSGTTTFSGNGIAYDNWWSGGSTYTAGDMFYLDANKKFTPVNKGTAGQSLIMNSGATAPTWQDSPENFIINGGAMVNQRVTAYTLVKDSYGISGDRLYGMATGTAVNAGTFETTTGVASGVTGYQFKFAGATITGTGIVYFRYRMESRDALKFKNQTASFSAKAYHDVGSSIDYTIYIKKANAADNFSAVTAISNDTAESVANTTATDIEYEAISMGDCSNGIEIEVKVECGAITTKNIYLTELQFELGSVATAFEHRNFIEELAKCQRYYWTSYDYGVAPGTADVDGLIAWGSAGLTSADRTVYFSGQYPTQRAQPTVTCYDAAGASGKVSMTAGDGLTGTVDQVGFSCCRVRGTNGAAAATAFLQFHLTCASEL